VLRIIYGFIWNVRRTYIILQRYGLLSQIQITDCSNYADPMEHIFTSSPACDVDGDEPFFYIVSPKNNVKRSTRDLRYLQHLGNPGK
jgi:hypothetical protein